MTVGCRQHCTGCGRHFSSHAAHEAHQCDQDPKDNPKLTRIVGERTICRLVDPNDEGCTMWQLWNPDTVESPL